MQSYYCEICGARVREDDSWCPNCKGVFSGLKCSRCGTTGSEKAFIKGCPECGYTDKTRSSDKRQYAETVVGKRKKSLWPTSLYWFSSAMIITIVAVIFFLWLNA